MNNESWTFCLFNKFHIDKIEETRVTPTYPDFYKYDYTQRVNMSFNTEQSYTLRISESDLTAVSRLMHYSRRLHGPRSLPGDSKKNKSIADSMEEELNIRESNDAVQKAFDHYKLLVAMARTK